MDYKHLFGPVLSRRLGLSLCVDLIKHKTCCFNCVYCECGATTELTLERMEYVALYQVIDELKDFLSRKPQLDYITFSGSGEPLLNKGIGGVTKFIRQNFPGYKIALTTNSALLALPEVRQEVLSLDLILPSLDAVSREVFDRVNRPIAGMNPLDILSGLVHLRDEFKGKIWLEIFIVPGVNDTMQELDLLSKAAERIGPDKVQINFLDRPGTETWVRPLRAQEIEKILGYFRRIKVEVIPQRATTRKAALFDDNVVHRIVALIQRRPCKAEDIAVSIGLNLHDLNKFLDALVESGRVEFVTEERGVYFRAKAGEAPHPVPDAPPPA